MCLMEESFKKELSHQSGQDTESPSITHTLSTALRLRLHLHVLGLWVMSSQQGFYLRL